MSEKQLETVALAEEYGVSEAITFKFIQRFSPSHVADNQFKKTADTMLFVHIPKTAGVSVGRSLREAYDVFRGVKWDNIAQSFRHETRQAAYMQTIGEKRQVIMGHYGWSEMGVWRNHEMPVQCATIFRDPVERVISNYNYNCSDAHPASAHFKENNPTLEAYVKKLPLDIQITQAIGFINSFETALQKFVSYYSFLGVTEHLSASLNHLGRSHGLPDLKEYRENVGKPRNQSTVEPELRQLIESRSHNDLKIHRLLMLLYQS